MAVAPLLVALLGLVPLPVSLPPLPEDARLLAVADANSTLFISFSGAADPNAQSENKTERLLAEPQVQHLIKTLEAELTAAFRRDVLKKPNGELVGEAFPVLVKALLTRPAVLFLEQPLQLQQLQSPKVNLVIRAGKQADEIERLVGSLATAMMRRAPDISVVGGKDFRRVNVPPLPWGIMYATIGEYFVVTTGGGDSAMKILQRLTQEKGEPAGWIKTMNARMPNERVATRVRLNIDSISQLVRTIPPMANILTASGLEGVRAIETTTSLNGENFVSRTLIRSDGPLEGVLAVLNGAPLKHDALKAIPGDSTVALMLGMDIEGGLNHVRTFAGIANPRGKQNLDDGIAELNKMLGFNIVDDLFKHLGTGWTIHNSPGDGGLIVSGATLTVPVKNADALKQTHEKILASIKQATRDEEQFTITASTAGRDVIHTLQPIFKEMPISPSWSLTDRSLVVALFPQLVRAHLARAANENKKDPLVEHKAVKELWNGNAPSVVGFVNVASLLPKLYPALLPIASRISAELQKNGVIAPVSLVPDLRSITPHLTPSVSVKTQTRDGLLMKSSGTLPPLAIGIQSPELLVGAVIPGILRARNAARRTITMNKLRQLSLAAITYQQDNGKWPPELGAMKPYIDTAGTFTDENGQPFVYFPPGKNEKSAAQQRPLFATRQPRHGRRLVAYRDGHVERVPENRFQQQMNNAGLKLPRPPGQADDDAPPGVAPDDLKEL